MSVGQKTSKQPSSDDSVAASLVCGILSAAKSIGLDLSSCLHIVALGDTALQTPTSRVDFTIFKQLLCAIQATAQDDDIGLRLGRELAFSSYNALGYAAANGETLYDALRLLPQYESLVVTSANTEIIDLEENMEVRWSLKNGQYIAIVEDMFFASWITLGTLLAGTEKLALAVHFTHQAPAVINSWHDTFGSDLVFDQDMARIIFSKKVLALPILQSDPFVHQVMTKEAAHLAAAISNASIASKVTNWLVKHLPQGEPHQRALASHLNMSERTLRRYLQRENTSYQKLLDDVRAERANYYLFQTSLPIHEISRLLGYQHLTAFNAAYKRWTGSTPGSERSATTSPSSITRHKAHTI